MEKFGPFYFDEDGIAKVRKFDLDAEVEKRGGAAAMAENILKGNALLARAMKPKPRPKPGKPKPC